MEVFAYSVLLQWKMNLRNKSVLLVYYLIPLGFWAFMGAIFSSINPMIKDELTQVLTVIAVSTGGLLGVPVALSEAYTGDIKKAYIAGNIKLWFGVAGNFISAFLHLSVVCAIIYLLTPVVFRSGKITDGAVYSLALVLFMLTSIAVGSVIGLYVKDQGKLTIYSQIVYMPSLMLSGVMFDPGLLPKAFETVGKILPATWGFLAMKGGELSMKAIVPLILILGISLALILIRLIRIIKE
jgi:ABC-2 type transport system permease protein